jgi:hypothetical protein
LDHLIGAREERFQEGAAERLGGFGLTEIERSTARPEVRGAVEDFDRRRLDDGGPFVGSSSSARRLRVSRIE